MAKNTSSTILYNGKNKVRDIRIYFNNCYNALILAQDRTYSAVGSLLQQNSWIPDEGRQALLSWMGVCQEENHRIKNYIEEGIAGLEKLFFSWETTDKLLGSDKNLSDSKIPYYNAKVERTFNLYNEKEKIRRFIPVYIYISNPSIKDIDNLLLNLEKALSNFNFVHEHSFEAEWASFFKKIIFKTKNPHTIKEIRKDLEKVKKAIDLKIIEKPQAEINKEQAESVSILINSLEGITQAALLIGTTLIIKNNSKIIAWTMSGDELRYVEKFPDLLKKPDKILDILSCYQSFIEYEDFQKRDNDAFQELSLMKKGWLIDNDLADSS